MRGRLLPGCDDPSGFRRLAALDGMRTHVEGQDGECVRCHHHGELVQLSAGDLTVHVCKASCAGVLRVILGLR